MDIFWKAYSCQLFLQKSIVVTWLSSKYGSASYVLLLFYLQRICSNFQCIFRMIYFQLIVNQVKVIETITAKNAVISPDFLVWKFYGKAQFSYSFIRIARNYAKTVPFSKIFTPGSQVTLRYFSQWNLKNW